MDIAMIGLEKDGANYELRVCWKGHGVGWRAT